MELKTVEISLPARYSDYLLHDRPDGLTRDEILVLEDYRREFLPNTWCIKVEPDEINDQATYTFSYKNQ